MVTPLPHVISIGKISHNYISALVVVRFETRSHFLYNCNQAIRPLMN